MISIIVPIYNTGKVLNKCLKSILNQSYRDIEVLLINDNSTDYRTNEIATKWADKDIRIVYIKNDVNLGIEKNRFKALGYAKGDFLMFVDHDDWFASDTAIEMLYKKAISTDADIVMGRSSNRFGFICRPIYDPVEPGNYLCPDVMDKFYRSFFGINIVPVDVWGKLYKMDVVRRSSLYPQGVKYCDDLLFNMFLWPNVERFSVIDENVYIHNYGGLSSKYNSPMDEYHKMYDIRIGVIENTENCFLKRYLDIEMKNVLLVDIKLQLDNGHTPESVISFLKEVFASTLDNNKANIGERR